MSKPKRGCPYNKPNCLECPFDDCYATLHDINRQNAIEKMEEENAERKRRDGKIKELYATGIGIPELSSSFNLSQGRIRAILKK